MKRVLTNAAAAECVRHKTPFNSKSGLLHGRHHMCGWNHDVMRYVVHTGVAPIYVFDFTAQRWVGNNTLRDSTRIINHYQKVETTAARHIHEMMPVNAADIVWVDHMEIDIVVSAGVAALVAHRIVQAAS